jgi:ParB-like chromosome segregation protein Spo0J
MSKLETIEAEVRKLPPEQAVQLQDWLANYLEDGAELNPIEEIERELPSWVIRQPANGR